MHAHGLVNHLWCSASVNENGSGFFFTTLAIIQTFLYDNWYVNIMK